MFGDVNRCAKIITSIGMTAFATFCTTFGSAGLVHLSQEQGWISLAYALFEASLATGGVIIFSWKRSPLTKDLKLSIPSQVEVAELELLKKGITTVEGKQ